MTERILGPTGGGRRRRLAVAVPLMALLALVVTGLVGAAALPPVPPAINAPTFQIEGNLEDNTGDLGVLDWADGTGGTGVIQANARTSVTTCTQTNEQVLGTPGVAGGGLLVCDLIGNNDANGFVQGQHEEESPAKAVPPGSTTVEWKISGAGSPKKTDLAEVMFHKGWTALPTPTPTLTTCSSSKVPPEPTSMATSTSTSSSTRWRQTTAVIPTPRRPASRGAPTTSFSRTTRRRRGRPRGGRFQVQDDGLGPVRAVQPAVGSASRPAALCSQPAATLPSSSTAPRSMLAPGVRRAVIRFERPLERMQAPVEDPGGRVHGGLHRPHLVPGRDQSLPGLRSAPCEVSSLSGINASLQDTTGVIPVNVSVCKSLLIRKEAKNASTPTTNDPSAGRRVHDQPEPDDRCPEAFPRRHGQRDGRRELDSRARVRESGGGRPLSRSPKRRLPRTISWTTPTSRIFRRRTPIAPHVARRRAARM